MARRSDAASRYPQSPGPGQAAVPVCLQFRGSGHPKLQTNHLPRRHDGHSGQSAGAPARRQRTKPHQGHPTRLESTLFRNAYIRARQKINRGFAGSRPAGGLPDSPGRFPCVPPPRLSRLHGPRQPLTRVPQAPLPASVPGPRPARLTQCHIRVDTTIPVPHWVTGSPAA